MICRADELTGFCMMAISAFNELGTLEVTKLLVYGILFSASPIFALRTVAVTKTIVYNQVFLLSASPFF